MKEFDPGEAPSIASIADKVRVLPVGMPVASIHFLGDTAVFVGAEENAVMVNEANHLHAITERCEEMLHGACPEASKSSA